MSHDRFYDTEFWMDVDAVARYRNYRPEDVKSRIDFNAEVIAKWGKIWPPNCEANISLVGDRNYLSDTYGDWKGEKVLVCGCGPSLKREMDNVKRCAQSGWKILCVDRAHSILKKVGITPDLTVTLDASATVGDFLGMVNEKDNVAASLTQDPRVLRKVSRRAGHIYFSIPINPFCEMTQQFYRKYPKKLFCVRAGMVVGLTALDIACARSGCEPEVIALIGNDLGWQNTDDVENTYRFLPINVMWNQATKKWFYTLGAFQHAARSFESWRLLTDARVVDCSDGLLGCFEKKPLEKLVA